MRGKLIPILSIFGLCLAAGLWLASYWDIFYETGRHHWYKNKPARIRKLSCRLACGQAKLVWGEFQAETYAKFQARKAGTGPWYERIYRSVFRIGETDAQASFSKHNVNGFAGFYTQWRPFFTHKDDLYVLDFPLWIPTLLMAVLFWYVCLLPWQRRRRWIRQGHCPKCGYDLHGSSQCCPECGTSERRRGTGKRHYD